MRFPSVITEIADSLKRLEGIQMRHEGVDAVACCDGCRPRDKSNCSTGFERRSALRIGAHDDEAV